MFWLVLFILLFSWLFDLFKGCYVMVLIVVVYGIHLLVVLLIYENCDLLVFNVVIWFGVVLWFNWGCFVVLYLWSCCLLFCVLSWVCWFHSLIYFQFTVFVCLCFSCFGFWFVGTLSCCLVISLLFIDFAICYVWFVLELLLGTYWCGGFWWFVVVLLLCCFCLDDLVVLYCTVCDCF